MFEDAENLDFNIFEFKTEMKGNELSALLALMFEKHDLFKGLRINHSKFVTFIMSIQKGYK
jgi:hypothetical protein